MTIHELVVGHGPVRVVALHGWFGSATGWGLLPELVDREAWSVAFLDARGYGSRKDVPGPSLSSRSPPTPWRSLTSWAGTALRCSATRWGG